MKSLRKAPEHLSDEAKARWREFTREYGISDRAGLALLESAMEAFDDMRTAQAILAKDGTVVVDRFGQQRQHPACLNLRDAHGRYVKALKALNFDLAPKKGR
jgi:P27 family predicted phage terminase small subunit